MAVPTAGETPRQGVRAVAQMGRHVLRQTPGRFTGAFVLMLGQAATSGLVILLLIPLVHAVGVGTSAAMPPSPLFTRASTILGASPSLELVLISLVALAAAQGLLNAWQARATTALAVNVASSTRAALFDAVCRTEWSTYARMRNSDLLQMLTEQVGRVGHGARSFVTLVSAVVIAAVYVALAWGISGPIVFVTLGIAAGLALLLSRRHRATEIAAHALSSASRDLYRSIADTLASMKLVRSFGAEQWHQDALARASRTLRESYVQLSGREAGGRLWFDTGAMATIAVIAYAGIRYFQTPVAELFVLLVLFVRLAPSLSNLYSSFQDVVAMAPALSEVNVALAQWREAAPEEKAPSRVIQLTQEVRLENVSFAYDRQPALADVSVVVPSGSIVALVGASGAGKSTIADILLGLLSPTTGWLSVDGHRLSASDLSVWRSQVAYVPQEPFLFNETIRANLLWAKADATEADLSECLEAAGAAFVRELPEGLETLVGDRGALLSGGERQRLALARALLRRPRLLVLDEATSALDPESEAAVADAILALRGRMAVVLITHRLSLVRHADWICVLEAGRVVEAGTWPALMSRAGRFRALAVAGAAHRSDA